ncbi:MAG: phosphatidate cytidylyltransferase [Syntrophobacterales bacterium]|nr:MAG: phosphatidate cytidylyltransferase [Syntrophobacterales bacterium]
MLKKRALTAAITIPAVLLLIGYGPEPTLFIMVLIAVTLGLHEFYSLVLPENIRHERTIGIILGIVLVSLIYFGDASLLLASLGFGIIFLSTTYMLKSRDLGLAISKIALTLFGIIYIALLLSYVTLIDKTALGKQWVFFLVATVWAADISGFFVGSLVGKHKLYPKVSPNKTIEGLVGGVIGATAIALVYRKLFLSDLDVSECIFLGSSLTLFGQMGDLTESMIKRSAHVKDSSGLIPGHGGMLDRLDSFLFSAPFLYYYISWGG